jgi:hypothetical protein
MPNFIIEAPHVVQMTNQMMGQLIGDIKNQEVMEDSQRSAIMVQMPDQTEIAVQGNQVPI